MSLVEKLGCEPIAQNQWGRITPKVADFPCLETNLRADVVVIGAGYSGLMAAFTAATQNKSVVVVEALQPGSGASGRNAGQIIPLSWGAKKTPQQIIAALGDETRGAALNRLVADSGRRMFEFIAAHNIACDARKGYVCVYRTAESLAKAVRVFNQWREFGGRYELLTKDALARFTASPRYAGGVWMPDGGALNPLKFTHGLARIAAEAGVRICGTSPARAMVADGTGWRVETDAGAVKAALVLIAAGAYADGLDPMLDRAAYSAYAGVAATDPLPDRGKSLLPGNVPVADMDDKGVFAPMVDADGRLLVSFLAEGDKPTLEQARRVLRVRFSRAFPDFAFPDFTHVGFGKFKVTTDGVPHILKLDNNIFAVTGCNGMGHSLGITAALDMARLALGSAPEDLLFPVMAPKAAPLGAVLPWALRHVVAPLANRLGA